MGDDGRGEFELIAAIRAAVGSPREDVVLGIGDDAAVLAPPVGRELVMTTDMLVEGKHFQTVGSAATARDVGWKALAVSVSDVAAMGGRSHWAVVSIALRPHHTGETSDALTDGLRECAEAYGVALVGGDTTATDGPLVINVALVGSVEPGCAVRRSGARVGDAVCVTGALGGSILGRHLRPSPRQVEALSLVEDGVPHSMIDLSDGLSSDLGHVLDASGVGAELWADQVPVHGQAVAIAGGSGRSALQHALNDGEDFELLFTTTFEHAERLRRDGVAGTPVSVVGVVNDSGELSIAEKRGGAAEPLSRSGHDHFRSA